MRFEVVLKHSVVKLFFYLLIIIGFASQSMAASVKLAWDENSETSLAGFNLFVKVCTDNPQCKITQKNSSLQNVKIPLSKIADPKNPSFTHNNLKDDTNYAFAVTAYTKDNLESSFSNTVNYRTKVAKDPAASDRDNDGVPDDQDKFPDDPTEWKDTDGDGVGDNSDAYPYDPKRWKKDVGAPDTLIIETGEVQIDHKWTRVVLSRSFSDPVVVVGPASLQGGQPVVVRLRNVRPQSFEIRLQEWDYLDGQHKRETVGFIAMERGIYSLQDGTRLEASSFNTNRTKSFQPVLFEQAYRSVPIVVASIATFNESDAVVSRLKNISKEGFQLIMEEQEKNAQIHSSETVSYIAWETSSGSINGLSFEVHKTGTVVTDEFFNLNFRKKCLNNPVFVSSIQTYNGSDPANIRWRNKTKSSISIQIDEEQSRDLEVKHVPEVIGYIKLNK